MSRWQQLSEQYLQLQLRERRLIYLASLALLLWLGALYAVEPLWQSLQAGKQKQKLVLQQMAQLQQQVDTVLQVLNTDPNTQIRTQISQSEQQRDELSQQIKQLTGRYVSPEQMLPLLQDVLKSSPEVKLLRMRSLQAEPVILAAVSQTAPTQAAATAGQSVPAAPLLYLHKTEISFSGQYAQLQRLLQQLEQLPWQLHWHQLEYKVSEHPQAELRLELETISEQADYLRI